ncbi:MAG: hypothetical protein WD738_20035 [Pirellulales bacterium]
MPMLHRPFRLFLTAIACIANQSSSAAEVRSSAERPDKPCAIQVIDRESGWPVPLVELRTTHNVRFITDNAGRVAFDLPELMGQETWFSVIADGYEVPADGFGNRGVRLTPVPGGSLTVEVHRTSIARRIGRITGGGLFAESQQLGLETAAQENGVLGCDSVQTAVHRGRLFWAWGDTTLARYPQGIFHMTGATTAPQPLDKFEPPLHIKPAYFTDAAGRPRGIAQMPGEGPTWLTGYVSLPDKSGTSRLVASYAKIRPPLEAYELGLCVWNDETENFGHLRTVWKKSEATPKQPLLPRGHAAIIDGEKGAKWVLFGDPLPTLRCPATFEEWQAPATWESLTPQETFLSAGDQSGIKPHSGSIAWNVFRQRWVTVFMQVFGKPSAFGEIWYAEADSPYGPWGSAVKVLSHKNYTFYNPRLHPEFTPPDSPILLFEGTYTQAFADRPEPTPRYDYNQILYRLDLDDPKLAPAQQTAR